MASLSNNLVTGRQLRAAHLLDGLTQRTLGAALAVDERRSASGCAATTASPLASAILPVLNSPCWRMV